MPKPKIVTFSDEKIKAYASLSEKVNKAYADKHGYNFEAFHERVLGDDWDVQWEKVRILRDELKKKKDNSYVIWIDADAAVNLHDISLENFMTGKDIVVSHDGVNKKDDLSQEERDMPWYVNTGVLMMKNTPWSRKFVNRWMKEAGKFKKGSPLQDQDKFVDMLKTGWEEENIKKHVTVLPPKALNSEYGQDTQNTFVWHLMKREEAYRKANFDKLLTRLTTEPTALSDLEKVQGAYYSRYRTHPSKASPVLIVMMYDDAIMDYSAVAENINRKYAASQGYDLMAVRHRLSERDPQWDKVRAMSLVMNDVPEAKGHEWFFWIDSDAVFARHEVDLKAILDEAGELVISDDLPNKGLSSAPEGEMCVNTGTFGLKNTDWARGFVKKWWETPMGMEKKLYHEQHVINEMYKADTGGIKAKVMVHPHDRLNSAFGKLPKSSGITTALDKTFVLHMMRKPAAVRRKVFDKVEKMVSKKGEGKRPLHVVDPPDQYYNVKPLDSSAVVADREVPQWVLIAILCVLVAALIFLVGRRFIGR